MLANMQSHRVGKEPRLYDERKTSLAQLCISTGLCFEQLRYGVVFSSALL